MKTAFDAACNLLARAVVTFVWDVIDAGGKWARQTDPKDD